MTDKNVHVVVILDGKVVADTFGEVSVSKENDISEVPQSIFDEPKEYKEYQIDSTHIAIEIKSKKE